MPRRVRKDSSQSFEPDSVVRGELRAACQADDSRRISELLRNGTVSAADATACLGNTTRNLSSMRMLLEHGADPASVASTKYMSRSFKLIKLLVEFGYDISVNGHCILQ